MPVWLNKAWIFRYVGDEEQYRQVVTKVLALAPTAKRLEDQRNIIEIAALGPFVFSAVQVAELDSFMKAAQAALATASTNEQTWGYRAIGQLQLRLGRVPECLDALQKSALTERRFDRAHNLMVRALCLKRLGDMDAARAAFDESEAIVKTDLPELLGQDDRFLPAYELYSVQLRREVQVVIGGK
jgi:tetratricopeptide (TPR) repeat protein